MDALRAALLADHFAVLMLFCGIAAIYYVFVRRINK
jgi:hypothetical protein